MSIEALAEPISTTESSDAASSWTVAPRPGQETPNASPVLAPLSSPKHTQSADAPVTIAELVGIGKCGSARGVRKRAERGFYGTPLASRPVYLFALDRLPTDVQRVVRARRAEVRKEDRRVIMEQRESAPPVYHLPEMMFNDLERAGGLERANFVNEVAEATRRRAYQTQDECFMAIVGREWRALSETANTKRESRTADKYPTLAALWCANGRGANGWRKARASYFVWAKRWAPWRVQDKPLYNYHVLCDHRRFTMPETGAPEFWAMAGTLKAQQPAMEIAALYREAREKALASGIAVNLIPESSEFHAAYGSTYQRFGDARFWADVFIYYEDTKGKSLYDSYNLARSAALKRGVPADSVPAIGQVEHFYRRHADKVAVKANRKGKKYVYDHLAYHGSRDWSNVHPHSMWVLDGREMDVWVRIFDKTVGPIDQATGLRSGGWRPIRPKMVHLIDAATFYQIAFRLVETPTRDTAELLLRGAIETHGGVAVVLHTDNGKDFAAAFKRRIKIPMDQEILQKVSDALGMRVIFAIHRNPQAKLIENYHGLQGVFEKRFPSYHGHNKTHQDALWRDNINADRKTLEERLEVYKDGPMKGCLVHPELLPTLDQFTQAWIQWRDEELNKRPKSGKIMRGKSPAEKFNSGDTMLRKLDGEEIRQAFLREEAVREVGKGGKVFYKVPGSDVKVPYWSAALEPFIGQEVQHRIELVPGQLKPRMYVFERVTVQRAGEKIETWKQIMCEGVHGSVPPDNETDALNASEEDLRQLGRKKNSLARRIRDGRNAALEMQAHQHALETLGLKPGAAGVDHANRTYTLAPTTERKRLDDERRAALAKERDSADDDLMKAARGA